MKFTDLEEFKKATPRAGVLQRVTRQRIKQVNIAQGLQAGMKDARLNYRAGTPSTFRTTLGNLGGTADAHYQNPFEFWKIREYVRDYDRNTPILGQAVDRALDQLLGGGPWVDPQTKDDTANADASALWIAWSNDPEQCDFTWRMTLDEMERLALRHRFIDGDAFAILDDAEGKVMLVEGDRVESSAAQRTVRSARGEPIADLVHGVEIDGSSRPLAYWFRKMKIGERQFKRRLFSSTESNAMVRVIRDHVIHVVDPKRITQSRGMSAFHAVFDRISMHEDIEFAQLVQQQVAACIAAFITSDYNQQWGSRSSETGEDNETELIFDEFQPGIIATLKPGQKIETFSPRNPTSDALKLANQIVREIGLALGLPLELALLVTSDTTFHGYRGVIEAYKITAKRQRKQFGRQFRSRIYQWKIRQWVDQGLLPDIPLIAEHVIRYPSWQYVDPEKEAKADALRQDNHLASPRQLWAERGLDYDQGMLEIIKDGGAKLEMAAIEADRLTQLGNGEFSWRDILGLPEESHLFMHDAGGDEDEEGDDNGNGGAKDKDDKDDSA